MVWRRRYIGDPFEELRRMEELVDQAFGDTGPDYFGRRALPGATGEELAEVAAPYEDIKEKEGKISVAADIPCVEKGDLSITIRGDTLEISAEKKEEEGYIRRERSYKKF